jgi:dinuclear metal center YbgI/SA1388 family protein
VLVLHNSLNIMTTAVEIAEFADKLLRSSEIQDYPNAINGLQIGTGRPVSKIAAAVDFSRRTVEGARKAGASLLIVHHGAFWGGLLPLTGRRFDLFSDLFSSGLGVYSSHLPLDCHPTLGNNALLAAKLGLLPEAGFGKFADTIIGVAGESSSPVAETLERARVFANEHGGRVHATPFAKNQAVGRWALCTGAGADADTLREAEERSINTLIVGEGPHWTAVAAEEMGITLICAGHYATETLGVQALAGALANEFGLEREFVAAPTGT